jgi:hypothetical protein
MREIHVAIQLDVNHGRVPNGIKITLVPDSYKLPDRDVTTLPVSDALLVIHWEGGVVADDFLRQYVDNAVLDALGYKRG